MRFTFISDKSKIHCLYCPECFDSVTEFAFHYKICGYKQLNLAGPNDFKRQAANPFQPVYLTMVRKYQKIYYARAALH